MNRLLFVAAVAEALTGVALLSAPSIVGRLLGAAEFSGVAVPVARLCGIALVALGLACYPGQAVGKGLSAMLIYSLLVTLYLSYLGFRREWVGRLLWPVATFHAALTFFLASAWLKDRQAKGVKVHRD
jgi:hypothetical protein